MTLATQEHNDNKLRGRGKNMTDDEILDHISELAYEYIEDYARGNAILLAIHETINQRRAVEVVE